MGSVMEKKNYLEGAIPYKQEVIEEYTKKGAWLNITYGELLDRASKQYPTKIAVVDAKVRLTYYQLKKEIDRLSIALINMGIKQYDRILLQMPNRYEFVVAFYAMQKIGAIPILAIPRHGYQEISGFIRLAEPVAWIIPVKERERNFFPLVEKILAEFPNIKIITLPNGESLPSFCISFEEIIGNIKNEDYSYNFLDQFCPDPNDVAVLIPTGGTTGFPKMVPRTHNSLIVANKYISRYMTSEDIILQATPVGHGMAMQGAVNCAIFRGATLVLQEVPRATEILETIQREKVTHVHLVPTLLSDIINHPNLNQYDISSLKYVGTTAAALSPELALKAAEYFTKFGCVFLGSALGASEGLVAQNTPDTPLDIKIRTVGRNVTPTSHYKVIDEEERELPPRTIGELVVKGPEVFTGYYKATKEEINEIFTHDGYFKTGDLASIDENGYITVVGRRKDVIIRGGETLIPSEIESLLRKHGDIIEAAVVGMPDPRLGERICAFIVVKSGSNLTFDKLIEFLKSKGAGVTLLPERIEIVEELPRTAVGKIDKRTLRKNIEEKLKKEGIIS